MKKLFPALAVATLFLTAFVISCKKYDSPPENAFQNETPAQRLSASSSTEEKKFHIFYVTWTDWGRTRKNCESGWGLCKAVSCWLCCTNDKDEIVDCKNEERLKNTGKVVIDTGTGQGHMLIKLDPSLPDQANAISNALPLYVDQDIENDGFIIQQGEYDFTPEIGSYGGYRLSVRRK
jgi:hypothetical protein